MRRWLGLMMGALGVASALGLGQSAVTLRWSWEVQAASSCFSDRGTFLQCQVPEGSPAAVSLSVSVDPARTVHVAPVSLPTGWPAISPSSGWGTVTMLYAFTPPPGSAGRRVEIAYRVWADGVAPLDLKVAVDVSAPQPSCPLPLPSSEPTTRLGTQARVPWSADRRITWDDFWAPPPPDRDPQAAAAIATLIEYQLEPAVAQEGANWRARVGSLTVTAAMERDRSWAVPDRRTPAGLQHEQRHFDLAEAYRRLLESELRGIVTTGRTASEAMQKLLHLAEAIFQEMTERHSAAQAQYDRETNHGRDAARQREWDRRIAGWLLDPYLRLP